jgi:hypothetical protein
MERKTDIIDYNGAHRTRNQHYNYFEQYTFDDLRTPTIYNTHQNFAHWQGVRHNRNTCEYFKSTQNEFGYRPETDDELENRLMSPGYKNFYQEITPERLARDPENVIHNYFNGWEKNTSDGAVDKNMLRSQLRKERKGNYFRVRKDLSQFIYSTRQGISGPYYHPDYISY